MMNCHINKKAISLDLNKVEGQTIHKKNSLIFAIFNDIKTLVGILYILMMANL